MYDLVPLSYRNVKWFVNVECIEKLLVRCVLEAWNHAFRSLGGVGQSGYILQVYKCINEQSRQPDYLPK